MHIPPSIIIDCSHGGKGLFASRVVKKGEILFHFDGWIGDGAHTNARALQIDEDAFLESTAKFDDFLNHSCMPNCYIDWHTLNLVAFRLIPQGEELTYNYNTSEYDLLMGGDFSFMCQCAAPHCLGKIKGFKYLSLSQKRDIQSFISPFLRRKLDLELDKR